MNKQEKRLLDSAKEAQRLAYAPYSEFKVGAAIQTEKNKIFSGCNVENASYGLTICAERTAICKAVSEGSRDIQTIIIYTETDELIPPCGACLQFICEFGDDIVIILHNHSGKQKKYIINELMPILSTPKC